MTVSDGEGAVVRRLPKRRRRFRLTEWPIAVVLIGVSIALILIATDHFRRGSLVLAASVVLATFLRLFLSHQEAGLMAVRSKRIDVAVLATLGIGLVVFGYWVPAPN